MSLGKAVVTAGGTREPIDDVRVITNFSKGTFGNSIAGYLNKRGYDTILLCPDDVPLRSGYINGVDYQHFTDTNSLRSLLLSQYKPDIIFHAAAVSDYRPKSVKGKISSDQEQLIIELERTPKILPEIRTTYGNEVYIVGFKLLSGASRRDLVKAGIAQNQRSHLNLTVANDLQNIHDHQHPVLLVTAEGGVIDIIDQRDEVAAYLVEFVRKRSLVNWYRTEYTEAASDASGHAIVAYSETLRFAQELGLLFDTSGNVSARAGNGLVVSPRQVDKSRTTPEEACLSWVEHEHRIVHTRGRSKSSIDTAVSSMIYNRYPHIATLLHFHDFLGGSKFRTRFPYPCGALEEGLETIDCLKELPDGQEFGIELLHHGYLLGLGEHGVERLQDEWSDSLREYKQHIKNVGGIEVKAKLKPIFSNASIVGVVLESEGRVAPYLNETARGKRLGWSIKNQLEKRQTPVVTIDECGVREFYRKHGFTEKKESDGTYTFHPPEISKSDELFSRMDEWRVP